MEAGRPQHGAHRSIARLAALTLLIVVGSLPLASADYLQASVDAARTGVTSELGPDREDVAFIAEIPGTLSKAPWRVASPIILDGGVYAAIMEPEPPWEQPEPPAALDTNGIVRVDLATTEIEMIVELDSPPFGLVSNDRTLYVLHDGGMEAYASDGSAPVWSWAYPSLTNIDEASVRCHWPAITAGTVYMLCNAVSLENPLPSQTPSPAPWTLLPGWSGEIVPFVAAVSTTTGETQWVWEDTAATLPTGAEVNQAWASPWDARDQNLGGISVIGDHVITLTQEPGRGYGEAYVHAFDASDGTLAWVHAITPTDQAGEGAQGQDAGFLEGTRLARLMSPAAGLQDEAYYVVEELTAVVPQTGSVAWSHPLPQVDSDIVGGNAFVVSGNDLFVASRGVLFKFDRAGEGLVWDQVIGAGEHFDTEPLVLAGNILYARTHQLPEFVGFLTLEEFREDPEISPEYFYAYNPEDGSVHWKHKAVQVKERSYIDGATQFVFAIAEGVMAIQGQDGTLRVLGATAASLGPVADVSDTYPRVRERVRVDLSATEPGVHGPASEYRAVWGDGTVTEWQTDPILTHAYASEGEQTAEFSVGNDAGQTATTTETFHVGETAPNLFSTVFAPENQDMTFGVLGVALALAGGGIGLAHRRRRRGRLARELDAIEAVHDTSRHEPDVCARLLLERKTQARALAVDGKLDQAHLQVIEARIDELIRGLRLSEVEEAFDFLPVAFVRSLRTVLEDGQVTRYERESLLDALEDEPVLTDAQKGLVRERLEAWFGEGADGP